MDPMDRSLLCHFDRERFLRDSKFNTWTNYIVNVQGKDGRVFTATMLGSRLGSNGVLGGDHDGLLWWPWKYE